MRYALRPNNCYAQELIAALFSKGDSAGRLNSWNQARESCKCFLVVCVAACSPSTTNAGKDPHQT